MKEIIDRIEDALRNGASQPLLFAEDARTLIDGIREMQEQIRALEKDLEFSRAGYDTVDCTPKEKQSDEEDFDTVSG